MATGFGARPLTGRVSRVAIARPGCSAAVVVGGVSPTTIAPINVAIRISQQDIYLSSPHQGGYTRLASPIGSALHSNVSDV